MRSEPSVPPEDIRRVRRALDETQAQFARRLGVEQVTVARWETGQRRCTGTYAEAILRLDPERTARAAPRASRSADASEATLAVLAQLIRSFFDGSTARAVSALLARESLSDRDLDTLARVIDEKRKMNKEKR